MRRNTTLLVVFVMIACGCCAATLLGGYLIYRAARPLLTDVGPLIAQAFASPMPSPVPVVVLTPVPTPLPGAEDTLTALEGADVPPRNLRELAERLKGISDIPETVSAAPANHAAGDELDFNVLNSETNANFKVTATLVYATENVYFFAENGVRADAGAVKNLVDDFHDNSYPTD